MGGQVSKNYKEIVILTDKGNFNIKTKECYQGFEENTYYLSESSELIKFVNSIGIDINSEEWENRQGQYVISENKQKIYNFHWSYKIEDERKVEVIKLNLFSLYPSK